MDATQPLDAIPPEPCFEEALAELEAIVRQLEEGQIGLAEGLARYEAGVKLLRHCYQLLASAERKIELLSRVDSDGHVYSEPLDDGALSLEEKADVRSRRRSQAAPETPTESETDAGGRLF